MSTSAEKIAEAAQKWGWKVVVARPNRMKMKHPLDLSMNISVWFNEGNGAVRSARYFDGDHAFRIVGGVKAVARVMEESPA